MQDLSSIWNQVEALVSHGISIIPVRDKAQGDRPAKTPYAGWKKYQSEIITKDELWKQMEKFNTTAIAIICGNVSGNLEVIDIDVKHKAGSDAILFQDMQRLYPDLFPRLKIHKTPSNGYHIIYRVDGQPEQNQKLASRHSTDDELKINPKLKVRSFLETRGEGGYIVAPPSLGYSVVNLVDIPTLTWEERCSIIELCRSYNEVRKIEKVATPKGKNDYYDENPFDHFNGSTQAEQILIDDGWQEHSSNANYVYFSRPGGSKSVHASFYKPLRLYYFWSTNTEFDSGSWYNPCSVLAKLKFNDDKKLLYAHLVSNGFGKIKPKVERQIVKASAQYGSSLPKNISAQSLKLYEQERSTYTSTYPFGIFWSVEDTGHSISREKLYRVSEGLGFRINEQNTNEVCLIDGYIVKKVTERFYYDAMKKYIQEEDADEYESIVNCFEAFVQKSGSFSISRLPIITADKFLQATKNTSYKFYQNCFIEITASEVVLHPYEDINKLVWDEQIHKRDFTFCEKETVHNSLYYRYLSHAIGISPHLNSCIGYLSHEYKDDEMGYIIVLTEQCPDPKQGGGSGKNIFGNLFKYITTFKNIPGTQVQYNEKFLQSWNFERVFSISDVPKKFDFSFLKELSTGSGILKKLFKDEVSISSNQMPKLLVSTNFSYEVSDGGLRRRIIPIEFTDFFTKAGGVNTYFNAMFPADWDANEWLAYDNYIASCIQLYLANNGKLKSPELTTGGKLKQFDMTFGQLTRMFIEENFENWIYTKNVKIEDFNDTYNRYCNENGIQIKYRLSSQLMNRALEEWCSLKNVLFTKSMLVSINSIKCKCKVFGEAHEEELPPF